MTLHSQNILNYNTLIIQPKRQNTTDQEMSEDDEMDQSGIDGNLDNNYLSPHHVHISVYFLY